MARCLDPSVCHTSLCSIETARHIKLVFGIEATLCLSYTAVGCVVQRYNVGLWPANCPVLRSTCSWWGTTYVGKSSAIGKPTSLSSQFGVDKWVVTCNWISATAVRGGAIWWTFTKERQAWCNLQGKQCVIHIWALCEYGIGLLKWRYINILPFLYFLLRSYKRIWVPSTIKVLLSGTCLKVWTYPIFSVFLHTAHRSSQVLST